MTHQVPDFVNGQFLSDRDCDSIFNPMMPLAIMSKETTTTFEKPWGRYTDYFRQESCVFKIIEVDSNQRLSLQKHRNRSETWIVLSGRGRAEIYQDTLLKGLFLERAYMLLSGAKVEIKPGEVHRLSAGPEGIILAELQYGECDEDDIIRLEDDYGRLPCVKE